MTAQGRCSGELCWYTLPLVDGLVVEHSKAGVLDVCEGGGRPPLAATDNEQRAAEVLGFREVEQAKRLARDDIRRITAALDAAEERGRQSVGLGDFLPNPCGDEYSSYPWYIAETYGDYVTCTLRSGHDGKHEHSDSGMTWSTP